MTTENKINDVASVEVTTNMTEGEIAASIDSDVAIAFVATILKNGLTLDEVTELVTKAAAIKSSKAAKDAITADKLASAILDADGKFIINTYIASDNMRVYFIVQNGFKTTRLNDEKAIELEKEGAARFINPDELKAMKDIEKEKIKAQKVLERAKKEQEKAQKIIDAAKQKADALAEKVAMLEKSVEEKKAAIK